jgi:hypothetical protein
MKALRLFIVMIFAGVWQLASAQAFEIKEVTSPGGVKAWLVSDSTIPMIAMNFSFRGGATSDPAGKQGRTYFLSGMLDEGAGDLQLRSLPGTHERTGRAHVLRRGKRILFRLVPDVEQQQGRSLQASEAGSKRTPVRPAAHGQGSWPDHCSASSRMPKARAASRPTPCSGR